MTTNRVREVREGLARRASDRREQFGATLSWFCMERLICRLAMNKELRAELLLGGDLLLFAICGHAVPYEWEAELRCARGKLDQVGGMLQAVCAADFDDGLVFDPIVRSETSPDFHRDGSGVVHSVLARLGANPCGLTILVKSDGGTADAPVDVPFVSTLALLSGSRSLGRAPSELMADLIVELMDRGGACRPKVLHDLHRLLRCPGIDLSGTPRAIASRLAARNWRMPDDPPGILDRTSAIESATAKAWVAYLSRSRSAHIDLRTAMAELRVAVLPWIREAMAQGEWLRRSR